MDTHETVALGAACLSIGNIIYTAINSSKYKKEHQYVLEKMSYMEKENKSNNFNIAALSKILEKIESQQSHINRIQLELVALFTNAKISRLKTNE